MYCVTRATPASFGPLLTWYYKYFQCGILEYNFCFRREKSDTQSDGPIRVRIFGNRTTNVPWMYGMHNTTWRSSSVSPPILPILWFSHPSNYSGKNDLKFRLENIKYILLLPHGYVKACNLKKNIVDRL